MCYRDDIRTTRYCSFCNKPYYGDLGHRGCQAFKKKSPPEEAKPADAEKTAPEAEKPAGTK